MVFPSHHIHICSDLTLAERETVKIELIFLPDIKYVVYRCEPFERKSKLPLTSVRLPILGQEPHALHVMKISKRPTYRLCSCKQSHRFDCSLALIISELILRSF